MNFLYRGVTPWAIASKRQICINRLIGRFANYTYPIYCKFRRIYWNSNAISLKCNHKIIVSLTTYPDRIDKVYLCINSLMRQTLKADKIVLWLADTQFPEGKGVPRNLLGMVGDNFEIRYCEDYKSYKKFYFAVQNFKNDEIIVTADDDVLYPESWLLELANTYLENPDCVCCYRAHKMVIKEGMIAPYSEWIGLSPHETGPNLLLVPTGVGGVLYPPNYFDNVEMDYSIIKKLCPTSDDLWLKAIGINKGYKVVKVYPDSKEWFTIISSQRQTLMKINIEQNMNDISIINLQKYYNQIKLQ